MPTKIKILYEDANILAIDKPTGVAVHPDGRTKEKTIADWVLKNYPKMKNVGELGTVDVGGKKIDIARPGVVHRLDRDTSGVLLLAKNNKAHAWLKEQFQNRTIKKTYNAVVSGTLKDDHGWIRDKIGRSPSDFRKWLAGRGAKGLLREAETFYKVLKRFESPSHLQGEGRGEVNKYTYIEVQPKTGRTHQIRVHMKFLNHAVVCDSLYNPGKPSPKGFERLALHAKSIEFADLKGNKVKVESPLPAEFSAILS